MKLGVLLRKFRAQKKMSQSDLAEQVQVSQSTYSAWESDRTLPNARALSRLAAVLNVDLNALLPANQPESTPPDPTAPVLYEALITAQKQTISIQQQQIDALKAEIQRLQARLP